MARSAQLLPLIAIVGPTASGKSALALELASKFNGYIVSADSRQIYRGLDIGTAKPTTAEQRRVRHFGLDLINPDQTFSVADFQRLALSVLNHERGLPFLVGGTGLYIDAVLQNWDIPTRPTPALRKELDATPLPQLISRLKSVDPLTAGAIDRRNKRRVIRALEVALISGQGLIARKKPRPLPFRVMEIGLSSSRQQLVERIEARVDLMIENGLLQETAQAAKKYGWAAPGLSGLGYRQLGAYLRGETTLKDAVARIKIETRQYAKRQMTWFKRNADIRWISRPTEATDVVRRFLNY